MEEAPHLVDTMVPMSTTGVLKLSNTLSGLAEMVT